MLVVYVLCGVGDVFGIFDFGCIMFFLVWLLWLFLIGWV